MKMVYEYTPILFALFFSFCGSEIQVSRQHMLWGPQLYSYLSNLIWILKIIETMSSVLFSYFSIVKLVVNGEDLYMLQAISKFRHFVKCLNFLGILKNDCQF